jgi:hypothetical protein
MAKADNTRRAYRAAVRAWCTGCMKRNLPPLPAAGCPVPTDNACVSETLTGIQRNAAYKGQLQRKKVAANATILRRRLAPIQGDPCGLRDRGILLVGFAGALRRSDLAAIRLEHLEKTDHGIRLTLPHSKGKQTGAVKVPLPYGDTELGPVHALEARLQAAGLTGGPVVPPDLAAATPEVGRPPGAPPTGLPAPPLPRIGNNAITPQTVAQIAQHHAVTAGFGLREPGGHSLKRGALTTGMQRGVRPAKRNRLGRHKSFDVLGEYLEFGDLFEGHPLSGVL